MRLASSIIAVVCWAATGCAGPGRPVWDDTAAAPSGPRTLLRWSSSVPARDHEKDGGGKEKGNGEGEARPPEPPAADESITTDRPTFTPSSRAVGKGHVQLETGYTFTTGPMGGIPTTSHSFPEAELRIGLFADWFELRLTQSFLSTLSDGHAMTGATDLLLGARFWLTEKAKCLPESSLIIQTTVPSGADAFTNRKMLPGVILVYSWDLIPDRVSLSGSSQASAALDTDSHSYLQLAQSLVLGYTFTPKISVFTEWYAQVPYGAITGVGPQNSFDSGLLYKITSNFQFDIRAGLGLAHTTDFFTGAGLSYRF